MEKYSDEIADVEGDVSALPHPKMCPPPWDAGRTTWPPPPPLRDEEGKVEAAIPVPTSQFLF